MLQRLLQNLLRKSNRPALRYTSEGRSGYVVYRDSLGDLSFYYEFGGGDCVASIRIPEPKEWTTTTGRTPESRKGIVEFIARQALKDQVSSEGYVDIEDGWIHLYIKT